jgi:hypothetical protein
VAIAALGGLAILAVVAAPSFAGADSVDGRPSHAHTKAIPGMARMHEQMMSDPGMARMHEQMMSGNPGMARMHEQMMSDPGMARMHERMHVP